MSASAVEGGRTAAAAASLGRPAKPRAAERPDIVLWSLALMHITYVWRLPSVVSVLKPLRLALVSGAVALVLFLLDRTPRRQLVHVPAVPTRLAAGLFGLMLLSAPAGLYPSNSASVLARTIAPALLLMLMLAAAVRSIADLEWFAYLNMLAAAGYCLFVLTVFRVGRTGRLEELIYYDANDLALLLVATIPTAAYFLSRGHSVGRRLAAFCSVGLFMIVLVATGSRGGFLGLLVVVGYLAVSFRGFSGSQRAIGLAGIAGVFVILGGATYFSKIETLLNPRNDYNWSGRSPTGRLEIWKRGLGYLADRPLLGVGVGNFTRAEGTASALGRELQSRGKPFKWSVAHNSYLETAVDSGALSLVLFLALFGTTLRLLWRVGRRMRVLSFVSREQLLAQTLTAALAGYLVCAFFISAELFAYPYVLLGMALSLAKMGLGTEPEGGAIG